MENSPQHLVLASGVNNGEGFWIVGIKNCDENILDDENLLDCHRKELIGNESAKDILLAINLNVNNLLNELRNKNYVIAIPSMGIPFDIPLEILENIFDFWLDIYKNITITTKFFLRGLHIVNCPAKLFSYQAKNVKNEL